MCVSISISRCSPLVFLSFFFLCTRSRSLDDGLGNTETRNDEGNSGGKRLETGQRRQETREKLSRRSVHHLEWTTRIRRGYDAVTTRLRRGYDAVTTRSPRSLNATNGQRGKRENNRHGSLDDSKRFQTTRPPARKTTMHSR